MKVTYGWLKDFVDIKISPEELAQKLTNAGMEVEEIIYLNEHLHHVVVGKILKIERHPNADKLQICQVDIGKGNVQIITAATNIFEGAVVPVSLPGANLANGIKIEKSKLRGVDSEGMFCSGEELGIDEVRSELMPADKVRIVEELLEQNKSRGKLAFVGDGINDAPVLSRADLGIAMGAMGSDAAIEAADVVLMDDDPLKIAKGIKISRKCLAIVKENIWFAIGIKVACLILGAFGIANMWMAIFADVGVMILAVLNAIRALFVKNL